MSLSRRDVLLASFAGFVAWGFAVRWFPILRYLGYAFVGGSLVTLFVLGAITFTTARKRSDLGPKTAIGKASVRFLSSADWHAESSIFASARTYQPAQLYPQSFVISTALDGLLDLVLRDFVLSWYRNITEDATFANEVDRAIRAALGEIRDRILQEDIVNIAVSRIVPIITTHLRDFDQAERLVRGRSLNRNVTESEELDLAIAAKYRDGRLHSAASLAYSDTKPIQQDHLRKVLVRILPDLLPESMMKSRAVSVLIKEIVACAVLFPIMQILSDPDTWNQLIEAYGRTALQDRKTVRKLRAALDQHASPTQKLGPIQDFPRLAPGDSERSFERFVRAIRGTNNLSEARRFRSQVASQLKRESMVEDQDQTYLRRLETGKRVLDQKVARLASKGGLLSLPLHSNDVPSSGSARSRDPTLVDIMHDSSGLSYFMEYMDRQNLMSLVQFWVVVDGFRNPLEDDFGDEASAAGPVTWSDADRNDIAQISEAYMSKSELHVPQESQNVIKSFLKAGRKATPAQYRQARTAVLMAQSAVLEELQSRHFPKFKNSDLYYKFLASDEASSIATPPSIWPNTNQQEP